MSFYRLQDAERDAANILGTDQWSSNWGGNGEPRNGVSVCGTENALIGYFQSRYRDGIGYDVDFFAAVQLVELDGDLSDDEDEDAAEGALLVHPTRIISAGPVPADMIAAICS